MYWHTGVYALSLLCFCFELKVYPLYAFWGPKNARNALRRALCPGFTWGALARRRSCHRRICLGSTGLGTSVCVPYFYYKIVGNRKCLRSSQNSLMLKPLSRILVLWQTSLLSMPDLFVLATRYGPVPTCVLCLQCLMHCNRPKSRPVA